MDKAKKKKIIVYVSTIILSIVYLFTAYKIAIGNGVFGDKEDVVSVRAKVLRITDEQETVSEEESGGKISMQYIFFEAKATSGKVRGKTLYAVQEKDMLYGLPNPRSRSVTMSFSSMTRTTRARRTTTSPTSRE